VAIAEMIILKRYSLLESPFPKTMFTLGMFLSALADIVITTSLCYLLRLKRSMIESTNRVIDSLTVWTVESGSVTCFATIATLICWLAIPSNRTFIGLHFVVAKLYANSLFATLNARIKIRKIWREATSPDQLRPITMNNVFVERDEESGATSPTSPRRHSISQFALQSSDKNPQSIRFLFCPPLRQFSFESSVPLSSPSEG